MQVTDTHWWRMTKLWTSAIYSATNIFEVIIHSFSSCTKWLNLLKLKLVNFCEMFSCYSCTMWKCKLVLAQNAWNTSRWSLNGYCMKSAQNPWDYCWRWSRANCSTELSALLHDRGLYLHFSKVILDISFYACRAVSCVLDRAFYHYSFWHLI